MQNPLRTDFQQHYEDIVTEHNREKDRVTIEKTFEALLKFARVLNKESLAIFDLLKKPELTVQDVRRLKNVAVELLRILEEEELKIDHWKDKESTRDAVSVAIRDFLSSDPTGLSVDSFTDKDVDNEADAVFQNVIWAYLTLPSPGYSTLSS